MICASSSADSRDAKRTHFTVPAVPTGMNTGVSMTPRCVVKKPARASSSRAMRSNWIGDLITASYLETNAQIFRRFCPQQHNNTTSGPDEVSITLIHTWLQPGGECYPTSPNRFNGFKERMEP